MDAGASSGNTATKPKVKRDGKSRRGRPAKQLQRDDFKQDGDTHEQCDDNAGKHLSSPSTLIVQETAVLPAAYHSTTLANQHVGLLVENASGASSPAATAAKDDGISNNSNSSMDKNSVHSLQGDVVDENSTSLRTTSGDAVRTSPPFEDIVGIVSGNIQIPQQTNTGARRKRKPEVPQKTFQGSSESGASGSSSSSSLTIDNQQRQPPSDDAFASLSMAPSAATIPMLSAVCGGAMNDGGEDDGNDEDENGSAEEDSHITALAPRQSGGWRRLVGKSTKRRKNYSPEALEKAIDAVCTGKLGTRRAAIVYGIPRSTLRNKLNKILPHLHHQQRNVSSAAAKPADAELLSPSVAAAGIDRLQVDQLGKSPSHPSRRNSMEFAADSSGLAEAASMLPSKAGNTRKRTRRRAGSSTATARRQKSATIEPVKEQSYTESTTNKTTAAGFDNNQINIWPQHSHNMLGMFRPAGGNATSQFPGIDTNFVSGSNPFSGEINGSRSNELGRMLFESLSGNGGGRIGIQPNFSATSQALYHHHLDANKLTTTLASGQTTSQPFMHPNFLPNSVTLNDDNLYQNHQNRCMFDTIRQSLRSTAHNSSIVQPVATGGAMSSQNNHNGSGADWSMSSWLSRCSKPQPFAESCGTSGNNLVSPQTLAEQQNPPLFASHPQTTTPVSGCGFPSAFNTSHTEQQFTLGDANALSNNRRSNAFLPSASAFMSSNIVNSSTNPSVPEWTHPITAATFWQQMMMMTAPGATNMTTATAPTATYQQPISNHSLNFLPLNHLASAPVVAPASDPHGMSAVGQAMLTLARFLASRNANPASATTVDPTTNYLATHAMPLLLGAAMAQLQQVATGATNTTPSSNPMALAMMLASSVLHQQNSHAHPPLQHSFHTPPDSAPSAAVNNSKPAVETPRVWNVTDNANVATKQESWPMDSAATVDNEPIPRVATVAKKRNRPSNGGVRQATKKRIRRRQQLSPSSSMPSSTASPHTPSATPNDNDIAGNTNMFSQIPTTTPSALSKSNSLSRSSSVAANTQSCANTFDQNAPVGKIRTKSDEKRENRYRRSNSLSPSSVTDAQDSVVAVQTDRS